VGGLELDEGGLTKAVVSTIGDMDAPMLPDAQVSRRRACVTLSHVGGGWCAALDQLVLGGGGGSGRHRRA
jgi:hypothetical protein